MNDASSQAETGVFSDTRRTPEKKWGFRIERQNRNRPVSAKELSTATIGSVRTDYDAIERLTQGSINRLDRSSIRVQGVIKGFREKLEEKTAANKDIDPKTHLSHLQEIFTFYIGSEDRYGMPTCYNFTDTKLTDDHLTEIAEALGEINTRSGSRILNLLRNIVFVPKDHPLMLQTFTQHSSGGHVFNGFPMIFISESLLKNQRKQETNDLSGNGQEDLIVNGSLKAAVLHEAVHLWQFAYPEEAKQFEEIVIESGEILPSLHGHTKTTIDEEDRHLEILPEAIVALSSPATESRIGSVTKQAVKEFQRNAFHKEDNSNETIARPTYIRCRQMDTQALTKDSPPQTKRWWKKPLRLISSHLSTQRS